MLDVKKAVFFSRDSNVPIIGIVENMSGLKCPHCHENIDVFKTGGGVKICMELGVTFLGKIPLDPGITEKCDSGEAFVVAYPSSVAAKAFDEIVNKCEVFVRANKEAAEKRQNSGRCHFWGRYRSTQILLNNYIPSVVFQ